MAVYDALRSFIWRQENYGPEALTYLATQGFLGAAPAQSQIAAVSGLTRETVNRNLRKLEGMGWIIPDASLTLVGQPKVYRMGLKACDTFGGSESVYAEGVMAGWYERLDAQAKQQHGAGYKHLKTPEQKALVTALLKAQPALKGGVTPAAHRGEGGVTLESHPHPRIEDGLGGVTQAHTLHFAPVSEGCDAAPQAPAGGCDAPAGGCDARLTPSPITPPKPENWPLENQGVTTYRLGEGGVILNHTPCDPRSHLTPSYRTSKRAKSLRFRPKKSGYIDSIHRNSLTTFGRNLRTSYSGSSLHSVSVELAAPTGVTRSLRSHASPSEASAVTDLTPTSPRPPAQTPTPVPPPPFPAAEAGGVTLPEGVTEAEVRVTAPQEAAAMPVYRFNPSKTAPDPSEGEIVAPDPVSGDSRAALASLQSVVEDAKVRSQQALAQKNQKRMERERARERKADNLSSTQSYRQQKSAAMRLEGVWREEMSTAFPDIPQAAWFKRGPKGVMARKEGKLASDLIDAYGDEGVVTDIIQTFVRHFATDFSQMLTKQPDSVPTFGLLYACHASVAAEAPKVKRRHDAIGQYEAWKSMNAGNDFALPPPELEAAYKAAMAKKGKK